MKYLTSIIQSSSNIILVPNRTIPFANLTNLGNYRIRLACGLKASSALPLYIQTSSQNIPVLNKYGNLVYSNQIKTRRYYRIGYGNGNATYTNGQFVIFDNVSVGTVITSSSEG